MKTPKKLFIKITHLTILLFQILSNSLPKIITLKIKYKATKILIQTIIIQIIHNRIKMQIMKINL